MGITEILFWVLAMVSLFSALMVITSKNPVFSVIWLIVTFFTISGHYVLLNAQFLAIVNIIVYAGAIMVLFLFVIMLMNLDKDTEPQKNRWLRLGGAVAGGSLLLVLVAALKNTEARQTELGGGGIGLIQNLGRVLFTEYVVPFELSSILFLTAMVGAVVIGKKDEKSRTPKQDEHHHAVRAAIEVE
ncbi:NADH-quinone oxidoreductase subunit J [Flaviaesturariibacter flavus]|uniref:NADH-quinone oxidoreductase subunit J n=1 Tax=Flaviaesturariibacter flavus TaxID=2502780 RepID=A0A4R1BBP7_9BACT|nr:NADH-quinone oxidoreductase subunit J [Flaviaesturariibacter flavus]TCJ14413.1 NADH-quinone oxidoreductase subunit J [Flaviaesturariibacter flavus]